MEDAVHAIGRWTLEFGKAGRAAAQAAASRRAMRVAKAMIET
jgi:hypothetical protein